MSKKKKSMQWNNKKLSALWADDRPKALKIVSEALEATCGNVTLAAKRLSIDETTLRRWMRKEKVLIKTRDGELRELASQLGE